MLHNIDAISKGFSSLESWDGLILKLVTTLGVFFEFYGRLTDLYIVYYVDLCPL